jgi:hypothetical protein
MGKKQACCKAYKKRDVLQGLPAEREALVSRGSGSDTPRRER